MVDDNQDGAEITGLIIEGEGHAVRVVHSGKAALDAALDFDPDVAVLDIDMPQMDGHELATRLRELPSLACCRMIALTGHDGPAPRRKSMAAGFSDHLVKPTSLATLLAAVCNEHEGLPEGAPHWASVASVS